MAQDEATRYGLDGQLEEGLTKRTSLVILYGAFILMPANIYLMLVAGQSLATPITFIALILWVELAKLTKRRLSTAEAFIVFSVSAMAASQMLFYVYALYPAYFRVSEVTNAQQLASSASGAKTYADLAPNWYAPGKEAVLKRTFLQHAWILPILIGVIAWICETAANITMGVIGNELFVKAEKLPFPFAHPAADACVALTQDKEDMRRVFTISGVVGTAWGLLVYWPVALGKAIIRYPIPWADFNARLQSMMKGAMFGIATDILAFTGGFIIPFRAVVSMLIGAVGIQVIGNYWAVTSGYFTRYVPGMTIRSELLQQRYVWMTVFIAAMVAAGLLPIISRPGQIIGIFKGLLGTRKAVRETRPLTLWPLLIIFVLSVTVSVTVFKILIPGFPWYIIAPMALIWSFIFSLIDSRAVGSTGFRVEPPYVREGMLYAFGSGASIWFAPWPVAVGASDWVQSFKVAALTRCKPSSLIRAALIALPIGVLANFLYMSIFWRIAPIPSATYPYAQAMLPIWAFNMTFWMSTTVEKGGEAASFASQVFNIKWMLITFVVFILLHLYNTWAEKRGIKWRLSLIGLAVGMVSPIPFSVSLFIGALAAKWVARKKGAEWFDRFKNVIVAGLVVGEGAVVGIFAAISALKSSLLNLPY